MSKTKKINTQNSETVLKRDKKKLNKRQRLIKQKLKDCGKIISNNNNEKLLNKPKNNELNVMQKSPEKLHSQSQNVIKNKSHQLSGKRKAHHISDELNKILKPITENKNPLNYSSNWEQLKNTLPVRRPRNQLLNKRKGDNQISQTPTTVVDNTEIINREDPIWFDGVDPLLIEDSKYNLEELKEQQSLHGSEDQTESSSKSLKKQNSYSGLTKIVALDCEMVGGGKNGEEDILARVSIVNHFGNVLYNKYVKSREPITDYRTRFSGIRPKDLVNGEPFDVAQKEVSDIIKGRIVVGHAIHHDFDVLFLTHPKRMIRDTSKYKPFIKLIGGRTPGLKKLSEKVLGVRIQTGEHDSIQDSQAAMRLYTLHRNEWEKNISSEKKKRKEKLPKKKKLQNDHDK